MRAGPMRPQMTDAEKKTRPAGQVKCWAWCGVQTSSMLVRAKFMTATWMKQERVVAATWAMNIVRGGIWGVLVSVRIKDVLVGVFTFM